jgi:hypothetical protein
MTGLAVHHLCAGPDLLNRLIPSEIRVSVRLSLCLRVSVLIRDSINYRTGARLLSSGAKLELPGIAAFSAV